MFINSNSEYDQSQRDVVLKTRLMCDLLFFTCWFFKIMTGKKFIVAPHHVAIAEALTKVVTGEVTRLIINIPPRYGKTELAVRMFIAWIMANNNAAKSIHISYSDDLALDNSAAIRDIVKSDEFQRMFPLNLRTDSDSKKKWYSDEGGGLYSVASGGAITGFGAGAIERVYSGNGSPADGFPGLIVIDDPLKPDDAFSATMMESVNRRYNNTIASRTNSKETPIVVIMQRLHEDDLSGFLLDGGSGEEWEHLCLPAVTDDGKSLWPEKLDMERLEQMRKADPYTFAGQYMQRPSPLGGGVFKDDWWQYYKVPPKVLWRCIYADTGQKTKEANDFTVLQCWGKTESGVILLDQMRGKWEAPELLKGAREFWNKHKAIKGLGTLRSMNVEDKASGTGLIQQLKRKKNDDGTPITPIPVIAIQRAIDKYTRACDAAPWIESGYVSIPEDAPWISDYKHEFSAFPNGKNDDQIDPTMDAIEDLLGGTNMQFISSEDIITAMAGGSGQYLGDDQLICGVYLAKNAEEVSYIQFRRGKDAMSETTYTIEWEKSKDSMKVVELLTKVFDTHKPDTTFIGEPGVSGIITDRLNDLGHLAIRINFLGKSDEELKYKDKMAESYWSMRQWIMEGGSINNDSQIEQDLVSITHEHNKKDQLVIDTPNPRASALALTFAYPVPKRIIPRGELDRGIGSRSRDEEHDPMDAMTINN